MIALHQNVWHRQNTLSAHTEVENRCTIYMNGRKEGNVLFNDTLKTFYLRLYGVR